MSRICLTSLSLICLLLPAVAQEGAGQPAGGQGAEPQQEAAAQSPIAVERGWIRMTVVGRPAAAYMTLKNGGEEADRLTGASAPLIERVELHRSAMDGAVASMQAIDAVEVPAGGEATLEPGGTHLMLFGLDEGLGEGDSVEMTLEFEKAGAVTVPLTVENLMKTAPGEGEGGNDATEGGSGN